MYEFKNQTAAVNKALSSAGPGHGFEASGNLPIVSVNMDNLDIDDHMTVVCSGATRGGSSIVPFLLHRMGLPMGAINGEQYEDLQFQKSRQSIAALDKLVAERNEASGRWGFKLPALKRGQLKYFDDSLRNPIFIYLFRNPLLTAHSVVSHSKNDAFSANRTGLANALDSCLQSYIEFVAFMRQTDRPCVMLSMEYLRVSSAECVHYLNDTLKLETDQALLEELAESVQKSGYKMPTAS